MYGDFGTRLFWEYIENGPPDPPRPHIQIFSGFSTGSRKGLYNAITRHEWPVFGVRFSVSGVSRKRIWRNSARATIMFFRVLSRTSDTKQPRMISGLSCFAFLKQHGNSRNHTYWGFCMFWESWQSFCLWPVGSAIYFRALWRYCRRQEPLKNAWKWEVRPTVFQKDFSQIVLERCRAP